MSEGDLGTLRNVEIQDSKSDDNRPADRTGGTGQKDRLAKQTSGNRPAVDKMPEESVSDGYSSEDKPKPYGHSYGRME